MNPDRTPALTPYGTVPPGFEAIYTGEDPSSVTQTDCNHYVDNEGKVIKKWTVWTSHDDPARWDKEILLLNRMQEGLGPLDEATRRIRAHIGSLVTCDNGIPTTIDQLLCAIGEGTLPEVPFHNGCWCGSMWWHSRGTQPCQHRVMQEIEDILRGYLSGLPAKDLVARYPHAKGFITRTCDWLGSRSNLTRTQVLMMERMLLPFEFYSGRVQDYDRVNRNCFEKEGPGVALDKEIECLAGLPPIHMASRPEYRENLAKITDPAQKELYTVCCHIAWGIHGLSDCHHAGFRYVESWIHGIGTGTFRVESRKAGAERERIDRLVFGFALALDKWLVGMPMQFLLLDMGHTDLGFDPKNEILRVFAHLGEKRTPTKEWLAGCLWWALLHSGFADRQTTSKKAALLGFSLREWMDSKLEQVVRR